MMLTRTFAGAGVLILSGVVVASDVDGLIPRQAVPKTPTVMLRAPDRATGRLIVKFADSVRARPDGRGGLVLPMEDGGRAGRRGVQADHPLVEAAAILNIHNAQVQSAFNKSLDALQVLEARAEARSGKEQPDLGGILHISAAPNRLESLAQMLNDLPTVEWVVFEIDKRPWLSDGGGGAPPEGGPPDCNDDDLPDCFAVAGGPCCNIEDCCDEVSDVDAFCCPDQGIGVWDEICVSWAHLLCDAPPADRCASFFNGSCYEAHTTEGCADEACCNIVCAIDEFCCSDSWDEGCVALALDHCVAITPDDATPDFKLMQGHLNALPYDAWLAVPGFAFPFPGLLAPPTATGFGGEGLFLDDVGEPYMDENGNGVYDAGEEFNDLDGNLEYTPPDPYLGLRGLAQELLEVYGVDATGMGNITRGEGARVAVIEWGMYLDHEAFLDEKGDSTIISEPGQTLILIPEVTAPEHGTACMALINAQANGVGVEGVVPDAQGMFFPLTSQEEGPREMTAWASALEALQFGDVISCSYGGAGNLNTTQENWTLIRLASDLGITVCIAAGNNCQELGGAADLGDSGGTVVGAGTPGFPYYRLSFSNHFIAGGAANGNIVHVQSWGTAVTTAGYGDLQSPLNKATGQPDFTRQYTRNFGGTSAATPITAGAMCALQGLAKQFYGVPLGTDTLRAGLVSGGIPQAIGTPRFQGGFDPAPCGLDTNPDVPFNQIGVFPLLAGNFSSAGSAILNQFPLGFDDAPLIDAVEVLRGELLNGNVFSIKGDDNAYLVIRSKFTKHGATVPVPPGSLNGSQIKRAKYLGGGDITDILVTGHSNFDLVTGMTITTNLRQTVDFSMMFLEMYDWTAGQWSFVSFNTTQGDPTVDTTIDHEPTLVGRLLGPDNEVLMRLWSLGFGGRLNGGQSHVMQYNLVNLVITGGP